MPPGPGTEGGPDQIGLWVVDLDRWEESQPHRSTLTPQDRSQAERLRHPRQGRRLLARRSVTRAILAQALGVDGKEVVISRACPNCGSTDHGRPFIAGAPIVFSVSSSGVLAAVAVSTSAVGVDIEIERTVVPQFGAMTQREQHHIDALAPERRGLGFLRVWTAKEAVIKAGERHLGHDPATVDVSGILTADETWVGEGRRRWHVRQLTTGRRPEGEVVLAVADEGGAPVIRRTVGG